MVQQHRIVNLDKKQVLDPELLGASRHFGAFAFTDSPVMGGLLWLLNSNWSGDRMAIVSNRADDSDLPFAESVCGIPASQLCFPSAHGHARFKNVSKKVREVLAADYGYRFQVREILTTTLSGEGAVETKESTMRFLGLTPAPVTSSSTEMDRFVIINRNTGQFIDSWAFCRDSSLRRAISNTWEETGDHSWLPTALAVLLTTTMEGNVFFVSDEDFSGSWAGHNLSVENYAFADLEDLEDISGDLKDALSNTTAIKDCLTPESPDEVDAWSNED